MMTATKPESGWYATPHANCDMYYVSASGRSWIMIVDEAWQVHPEIMERLPSDAIKCRFRNTEELEEMIRQAEQAI